MTRTRGKPQSPEVSTRARSTRRVDLSGLDMEPDVDDEEFVEQQIEPDNEDDFQISDDDEVIVRKARKRTAEELDDDEDEEVDDSSKVVEEPKSEEEEEGDEEDGEEEGEEGEGETTTVNTEGTPFKRQGPKKRGRKKLKVIVLEDGTFDEEGNPLNVDDDEVVIANEDEAGKTKVDAYGNLAGGRDYRIKTFKVNTNPNKLFMISTEPARLVGFRDSYLLFKTHRTLFKKVCTHDEKMDLIDRAIIPNSYKGRSVNLVAARSIYREFGAKMIKDGKKVIDDFWEQRAIDNGDIAGEYADPNELFNKNRYGNLFESNTGGGSTPLAGIALINYQSDPSWIHQIAKQTHEYNNELLMQRNQAVIHGIKDPYTNLSFFPGITQPTKTTIKKIGDASQALIYDTVFSKPSEKKVTGLRKVPKEVFEDIDDQKDILAQQKYESTLV